MTVPKETIWAIEPHTLAKHEILRRYLGAWFPIITTYNTKVLYIDGFCGPGRYAGGEIGSPVLAVQEATKHGHRMNGREILFYFMDERADRIDHLRSELDNLQIPANFHLGLSTGEFEPEIRRILKHVDEKNLKLVPTFAFIDPFGFKGLPFDLVRRLLQNSKTEVFINVMADSVNRFLTHPNDQVRQRIVELFGIPQALEIAQNSTHRIEALRLLYQQQLSTCAEFVRYFEMRNSKEKTIYYLFFASNNSLGHLRMKEAFWGVDKTSGFCFSDATDPKQLLLFEVDQTSKLASELENTFSSKKVVVKEIERYVIDKTAFLGKHMRTALKLLEEENRIMVDAFKEDGTKRKGKSFPAEVIVNFN